MAEPTNDRVIPSLAEFYEYGLTSIQVSTETDCSICFDQFEASDDAVSVNPCKHSFHRGCAIKWFRTQLLLPSGARNTDQKYGTCPMCRCKLFEATHTDAPYLNARTFFQRLHEFRGTEFDDIVQAGFRHLQETGGCVSVDLTEDIINRMVEKNRKAIEPVLLELNLTWLIRIARAPVRLALKQYQVDVETEQDPGFINHAIRADIQSLNIIFSQHVPANIPVYPPGIGWHRQEIDWISMIDSIRRDWYESGYPRTTYITRKPLHNLMICAALISRVGAMDGYNNTVSFAQLLARGDGMLLEAQKCARRHESREDDRREHFRLLNWNDDYTPVAVAGSPAIAVHLANAPRVRWIVELRRRTRGPNVDPLGPRHR